MMVISNKTRNILYLMLALLATAFFLTICSENSFLYKMNVWGDVNCYYTVSKSMLSGKVLYRDIYEQKGLYLYAVHILAVLISNNTYIGMYVMEILFGFIFAISMYKILGLFMESSRKKCVYTTLIMLLLYIAPTFCQGDSAEEMTLPLMGVSTYFLVKAFVKKDTLKWYEVVLSGIFAGIAIFIKFTLVSYYIPFCIFIFFTAIKDKKIGHAFLYIPYFILGLGIAITPALLYFGLNNALPDLWEGYFYNNLFLYSTAESRNFFVILGGFLLAYGSSFAMSYTIYPLIIIGFIYMFKNKEQKHRLGCFILTAYILMNFLIFIGGRKYNYYSMPMNIFTWYGIVMLDKYLLPKFEESLLKIKGPMITFMASSLVICFFLNGNTYHIFRAREDYHQFQFKDIIMEEENPTLLNYGFLDMGLYHLCGIEPNCKYFSTLNIELPEMYETQKQYIRDGLVTFVVTRDEALASEFDKYELVKYTRSEYGKAMHDFYLYRLID